MDYEQKYEQKYREALGWMRSLYDGLHGATKEDAEHYFPELKENKSERVRKGLIKTISSLLDNTILYHTDITKEEALAWLEKQSEQKHFSDFKAKDWYVSKVDGKIYNMTYNPADKVEPKFKVGDWILNDVCFPLQIASIRDGMYVFTKGDAMSVLFIDGNYHLWSINDAKDGDVLVAKDDRPFIFTGEFDVQDDNPIAYCGINSDDEFITGKGSHWTFKDGIKPATKEQRDTLERTMTNAGYKWDSEKKKLKKIEVKTLNSNKVIAWIVANICDFEYYVKLFKKDFGL